MKLPRLLIPLALLIVFVGSSAFFVVQEGHQALITQFGKPVGGPYKEAGLYFKIPMIQEVHTFEQRILKWDGSPNQIPTRDKKYIWVDTTARWRITDPLKFLQTVSSIPGAMSRLDDIIDSIVRDMVSSNLLVEIVRSSDWNPVPPAGARIFMPTEEVQEVSAEQKAEEDRVDKPVMIGRQLITRRMLAEAGKLTPQYGIELIDVEIKRINYVESVQKRVYERMISERKRIASQYRSEGEGEKRRIMGTMQKELARIRSEAYRKSQEIRGAAEAEATRIYGDAFGQDPEFYAFFKTLESYKDQRKHNSDMILSTESEYYKYLNSLPE